MKKKKTIFAIAIFATIALTVISCVQKNNNSTFYKTGKNEICTYKVMGVVKYQKLTDEYIHYDKVCTEYGSNVVELIHNNDFQKEKILDVNRNKKASKEKDTPKICDVTLDTLCAMQ